MVRRPRAKTRAPVPGDLCSTNTRARTAALRALSEGPAADARASLEGALRTKISKATRRALEHALHDVADVATARALFANRALVADRLPMSLLAVLYDDLRAELPKLRPSYVGSRLDQLGVSGGPVRHGRTDAESVWRTAAFALGLAVLDDPRLPDHNRGAIETLRYLDPPRAEHELLQRWSRAEGTAAGGLAALEAWLALGAPRTNDAHGTDTLTRLLEGACQDIESRAPALDYDTFEDLSVALLSRAGVPILRRLLLALGHGATPLRERVAEVLVAQTPSTQLVALLDETPLRDTHERAAAKLAASGRHGARTILERREVPSRDVLVAAFENLEPAEAYDLVVARPPADILSLVEAAVRVPAIVRDRRWLDLGRAAEPLGRLLLVAIARDVLHPDRARAVERLAREARHATERLAKRHALFALGETGHVDATPALVEALDDEALGDGAPLVCTALGACGDTRALPVLELRTKGVHGAFVRSAIAAIEARAAQIQRDVLTAAMTDPDPILADLARRAQAGDTDAAVVLEDALRERGRL